MTYETIVFIIQINETLVQENEMLIGYARVSTKDQESGLVIQIEELEKLGCEKIFTDMASGADITRKGLKGMTDYAREGDTVICTKTDRIARDTIHALQIADGLKVKKVGFKLMDLGDTDINSNMGRVIYTIISALATAERERIKERTAAGRKKAIEAGVVMGRPKNEDNHKKVVELLKSGVGATEIAREVGIGRASVYRIKKELSQTF